jgi:hypothetical protein
MEHSEKDLKMPHSVHRAQIKEIDDHFKGIGPKTPDDFLSLQKVAGRVHPGHHQK